MLKKLVQKHTGKMRCDYQGDLLGVRHHSIEFMHKYRFANAWEKAYEAAKIGWNDNVPDIRWRVHIAIWAAENGLNIEGDFVECGVHTGILSLAICHYLDFSKIDRKFWLFDTWEGIPEKGLSANDLAMAKTKNEKIYSRDIFADVQQSFRDFPNCQFVRGMLPETIHDAKIDKIAYLSIDLNNTIAEKASIELLWPKMSKGAFIVLDDYGWTAYKEQRDMWDNFAQSVGQSVATLPTGQGLLVKN